MSSCQLRLPLPFSVWQPGPGAPKSRPWEGFEAIWESIIAPCDLWEIHRKVSSYQAFSLVSASVLLGEYSLQLSEENSPREHKALPHYHTRNGRRQGQGLVYVTPKSTLVPPPRGADPALRNADLVRD